MKQARLYARVSTDEQSKKGLSIPVQIEKLKQYCKDNGYNIADIYIDNGISASTIVKRHEFVRMLDELQQNDTILVTRLDRMSRNVYDANYLLKKFDPLNVRFKAILEDDIDTTTADGKFIFDLKVSLAERERKKTSERIRDVFDSKRAKGEWVTGVIPLGYKVDENKHLVIDETTAKAVQSIFETYAKTNSIKKTQEVLKSDFGIERSVPSLYHILKAKRYIGIEGNDAIISTDLFNQVRTMMKTGANYDKVNPDRVYLFQGLIECNCGRTLCCTSYRKQTAKGQKEYNKYRCYGAWPKSDNINHLYLNESKLEKAFLKDLSEKIKNDSLRVNENLKHDELVVKDIERALEKQDRLKEMYIEGFISRERFNSEISSLEPIISKQNSNHTGLKSLQDIDDIISFYNSLDKKEKRIFIISIVEKIKVRDRKIIIIYR